MRFSRLCLSACIGLSLPFLASARGQVPTVNGVIGGVPHSHTEAKATPAPERNVLAASSAAGNLRYIENSGVCETTPGVYQASGYADIAVNQSMWFWFFAARNNSSNAPVSIWINGGPGSSSMIGLLQENGPCRINADEKSLSLNPNSWNNNANMLYIDQPIGAGFSYGTLEVNGSVQAAQAVWKMLQIFFSDQKFAPFADNDFAIWTESYGGHYGPAFAKYFLEQNAEIAAGRLHGITLNLKTLGIGNGITDALSQYPQYMTYAASNPYRPTASLFEIARAYFDYYRPNGCNTKIQRCYATGAASICSDAQDFCNNCILDALVQNIDVYDVRQSVNSTYPPDITALLTDSSFVASIGAESAWEITNYDVYANFAATGDWMLNYGPSLECVIDAGIRTVIYDGDADYICNYKGVEAMVDNLKTNYSAQYQSQPFTDYTVAGNIAGIVKNVGTFSYLRVFGAGHEVPAYNYTNLAYGQVALQFFEQAMRGESLTST